MWVALILIIAVALFGGCSLLNRQFRLPDDNIIEEAIEEVIEIETGLPIDLTPKTKE